MSSAMRLAYTTIAFFLSIFLSNVYAQEATSLYWSDARGIHQMQLDTRERSTVMDFIVSSPESIAVDTLAGKIYWADRTMRTITRANLDGTAHEVIAATGFTTDLALDLESGHLYWTSSSHIYRANLDGSELELLYQLDITSGDGIALDLDAGQVYWTDKITQTISRANLDGTAQEVLIDNAFLESPKDLILDVENGRMYWTDLGRRTIESASLDGLDRQTVVPTELIAPVSLLLDTETGQLYWIDQDCRTKPGSSCVERANPDGTARETVFVIGPYRTDGIALDPTSKNLFWTSDFNASIERANLDGSDRQLLLVHPGSFPYAIAVDQTAGKIYWTDASNQEIRRMNLDGSENEVLISERIANPFGMALDVQGGKMYWVDPKFGARKPAIERANLDGTNREELITTDIDSPSDIALDLVAGKFYWTDYNTERIERANLDGTDRETLVTGLSSSGIALDVAAGKMYWSNSRFQQNDIIEQANLDGSERKSFILSGLTTPTKLEIDPHSGHLYWLQGLRQIERATLVPNQREFILEHLIISPSFVIVGGAPVGTTTPPVNVSYEGILLTNYPNPFRQSTTFEVVLSTPGLVKIKAYDILGQAVATLVNQEMPAGKHDIQWSNANLPSGPYMVRMEAADKVQTAVVLKID